MLSIHKYEEMAEKQKQRNKQCPSTEHTNEIE